MVLETKPPAGLSNIRPRSKMNNLLLPVNDDFVEVVAKAIARNRMYQDASAAMEDMIGIRLEAADQLESTFEKIFDRLWSGTSAHDERQKAQYRSDAKAAIAAINLKLLVSSE